MKHLKLLVVAVAFAGLCISGCSKSDASKGKEVYDKVLQMYEKTGKVFLKIEAMKYSEKETS